MRKKYPQHSKEDKKQIINLCEVEKNVRQKRRYDVIRLYLEGYRRWQISDALHISENSVGDYICMYEKGGIEALKIKKQPGKPRKLSIEQEKELYNIITTSTPEEAGVGVFANWTAPLACRLVKERYHVEFSERGMRNLFQRIGLSYTRPTYTLKNADPNKQEQFKQDFQEYKKTQKRGNRRHIV